MARTTLALTFTGAVLLSSADASAGTVTFAYEAPPSCPPAEDFAAAVAKRGRTVVAATKDATLRISVTKPGAKYKGLVAFEGGTREVEAATCADVVTALAVVTVGAIGPDEAETTAAPPSVVEPPTTSPAAPDAPPPTPAPPAPPTPTLVAKGPIHEAPPELAVGAGKVGVGKDVSLTAQAGFAWGLLPSVTMPRYDLLLSVANFLTPPDGRTYRVGALVRVRATLFGEGTFTSSYGVTRAEGFAVGLDVCAPLHFDREGLVVQLCPTFSGGQLVLRTRDTAQVETQRKVAGFGTAGLGLGLAYNVVRHFHVGLEVGGDAVLGDRTAEDASGKALFESTRWTFRGALALGATF